MRVSGYHEDNMPTDVRCPDCGRVPVRPDTFDGNRPVSAICPQCGDRIYFDDPDDEWDEYDNDREEPEEYRDEDYADE